MKHIAFLLAAITLMACGGKKQTNDITIERIERPQLQAPISQQADKRQRDVQWLGRSYQVTIERTPADSLPLVSDETGQQFVDNVIRLTVTRQDGSVFFDRRFTKSDFAAQLDDDFRATGILEGMVFDEVDDDQLEFAASVSHPQTDEYIPLEMKISRLGKITIKRDSDMDTHADDDDDD